MTPWRPALRQGGSRLGIYRGVLVRWSPTGDEMWASIGSATQPATVYIVTVDPAGNAYVAGSILRGASSDGVAARFTRQARSRGSSR